MRSCLTAEISIIIKNNRAECHSCNVEIHKCRLISQLQKSKLFTLFVKLFATHIIYDKQKINAVRAMMNVLE